MQMQDWVGLGGVPLVTALIEVVKPWLPNEPRWYPPLAIALGLALNLGVWVGTATDIRLAVIYGILSGLAASGLYSTAGALRGANTE